MSKQAKGISLFLLFTFCIGMMIFSPVALAAEPQQQFVAPRLVVNSSFLNVRSGPGIQYSVLLTVVGGTELPVLGRASDNVWFQVSTVIGVGWVNVQYTVPRGSFENVPVIQLSEFIATSVQSTPITLGLPLGQGGGAAPEVAASTVPTTASGTIRVTLSNNRVTTVSLNERFRAVINVEAVNLRTQPVDGSPTLGTVYRDDTNDYPILGSSKDNKTGVEWIAIEVVDVGVGWIEAAKVFFRLSRAAGTVMQVAATLINMTDAPSGSGDNLPVLQSGAEAFLRNISRDGKFVQIELGDGTQGWVPFDSVVTRSGTPTDEIDFEQLVGSAPATFVQPGTVATNTTTTGVFPATFGLDTPHIVINTGFLNIRSGPGAQYSIVATLSGGTELPVIGIAPDNVWYLVEGPFGRGWVNNEFVVFRGAIQAVPIIRDFTAVTTNTLSAPVAVVAGSVTLYAAPGTNFGAIGVLNGPIEVPIVARTADSLWLQLNTSAGFGWVVANQVIVRGDGSLVPIVG